MPRLPRRRPDTEPDPRPGVGPTTDGTAALGALVARVADGDGDRRAQLAALTRALAAGARGIAAGGGASGAGQLLADVLTDAAPRLRIRDAATLYLHHPGKSADEIAEALVRTATRTTAAFGAAVGALAALRFAAPPTLPAAPAQLAAETLAVAAVEVRLVAELHEILGDPARGSGGQRASAYLMSWVRQRALDPRTGAAGLSAVLGAGAKRELSTMLTSRAGRGLTRFVPFLAGAVAGGVVNRRVTRSLGDKVAAELRVRRGR